MVHHLGLHALAHADTPIGTIYLVRRPSPKGSGWVHDLKIDGQLLMSSLNNLSERSLATRGLALHNGTGPRRVLVGGLGLGHTAQAALAQPRVTSVRVLEKMDFIIDWMEQGLLPLSEPLTTDDRFEMVQGDVYDYLLGPAAQTYDVILVDVDHAPDNRLSEASLPFYSLEGQARVVRHLAPGGVLAVWSATDNDDFAAVLGEIYSSAHREGTGEDDVENPVDPICNVLFFGERGEG